MSTLLLTCAVCPICLALRAPHALTRDEDRGGLICRDRVACLREKAAILGLVPRKDKVA